MAGQRGRLFVITAPSGAGKTTLTRALLASDPGLRFSVSYTTRPPRAGEENGRDYLFVSHDEFRRMIERDALLEHARVFDHFYGTGRAPVEEHLAAGRNVLLDIDWQGAGQVRAHKADSVLIFIMPPSLAELERRLRGRGTDREEVIRRRLGEARADMARWRDFDFVVINDQLTAALDDLRSILAGTNMRNRSDDPALGAALGRLLAEGA